MKGQKGGNLFRYLPGDFPPTSTQWLTTDDGKKTETTQTTNGKWKVNERWDDRGTQKGKHENYNVIVYAIQGDSPASGASNHNTRNNKNLTIKAVYEPGVDESVKTLSEYGAQKTFLEKGGYTFNGSTEQKPGSMYEKVGMEFRHQ